MLKIEQFLNYLKCERQYSPHTVATYKRVLTKAAPYLEGNRDALIKAMCFKEDGREYAKNTVRLRYSVLRAYGKFLNKFYHEANTLEVLDIPKAPAHLPNVLSDNDVTSLINASSNLADPFLIKRNRALCSFMYDTGVRVSELVNITLPKLNLQENTALVLGKGDKERLVLFTPNTCALIQEYLIDRDKRGFDSNTLFVSYRGKPLNRSDVTAHVKLWAKQAGLEGPVSAHTLRHSFATSMVANGADLRTVQTLLGHSNISTTQLYVHLNVNQLKDAYNKARAVKSDGPVEFALKEDRNAPYVAC